MNFLNKIKAELRRFFYGRYGGDSLNLFLLVLSIIIMNIRFIWIFSYIFLGIAIFRSLSKDHAARQKEQNWYNKNIGRYLTIAYRKSIEFFSNIIGKSKGKYKLYKKMQQEKNEYAFFKCNSCGNTLRVPKNKGKVKVTCPVCKTNFEKTT